MKLLFTVILLVTLSACGQQPIVLPTPVPTSTLIPATITPSRLPTQPIIPVITADPIQVEKWKEYEDAVATALFPPKYNPRSPGEFLCEWEILGRSDLELYVWTVCMSIFSVVSTGLPYHAEMPAVIHIGVDGAVQSVEIPGGGSDYAADIRRMFPPDSQKKYFDGLIHFQELTDHLNWRREHPEEPPLIVLSSTSTLISITVTPSPLPTQPIILMITPDAIQVERWKEYEDALARTLLSFLPREEVICEWEILGRSEQEVYIWAVCTSIISSGTSPISGTEIFSSPSIPAVIHLGEDGSVQSVEIPGAGSDYARDISQMFPSDVQREFNRYHFGRAGEMLEHAAWRRTHPEEPPLIILSATPIP